MVCLHTGFADVLLEMNKQPRADVLERYGAALEGRDPKLLQWITDTGLVALIADNYAVEAHPPTAQEGPCAFLPLHQHCLFKLGVHLGEIWHLSPADFGEYRVYLFFGFLAVALLSFKCVPDFLAVRGLATVVLMGAMPLLDAGFMNFEHTRTLLYKFAVYLAITAAVWLGAQPWRLRDFLAWLFARPARPRVIGGVISAYGLTLAVVAFSY